MSGKTIIVLLFFCCLFRCPSTGIVGCILLHCSSPLSRKPSRKGSRSSFFRCLKSFSINEPTNYTKTRNRVAGRNSFKSFHRNRLRLILVLVFAFVFNVFWLTVLPLFFSSVRKSSNLLTKQILTKCSTANTSLQIFSAWLQPIFFLTAAKFDGKKTQEYYAKNNSNNNDNEWHIISTLYLNLVFKHSFPHSEHICVQLFEFIKFSIN